MAPGQMDTRVFSFTDAAGLLTPSGCGAHSANSARGGWRY